MYAVVDIQGQQIKVAPNQEIFVNRLSGEVGDALNFEKVLLLEQDDTVQIGTPNVGGASVKATIVEHLKGDKVIVFKKKRRKGYKVSNGHRQYLTKIKIDSIS